MRLGVVMPVYLQTEALLDLTCQAAAALRSSAEEATLYVVCNRLHGCTPEELRERLQRKAAVNVRVLHEPCVERSVAGAWNHGAAHALRDGADLVCVAANDVVVEPDCLDRLAAFGGDPAHAGVAVWSGIDTRDRKVIDPARVTDGCDFACFMLRPRTIGRHGWFDAGYKPAYAEDNDYYTRVVLGGEECRVVHAARFFHHGSMTIRLDPEAAHHVRHWFDANLRRYREKWGAASMPGSREEVLRDCFKHPYNDPSRPLCWWPDQEVPIV
jgi:GT2 family glycosyltransferase